MNCGLSLYLLCFNLVLFGEVFFKCKFFHQLVSNIISSLFWSAPSPSLPLLLLQNYLVCCYQELTHVLTRALGREDYFHFTAKEERLYYLVNIESVEVVHMVDVLVLCHENWGSPNSYAMLCLDISSLSN